MRPAALAEAVLRLPWICPGTAALLALARSPTAVSWEEIRTDPGAVLLILRHSANFRRPGISSVSRLLSDPCLLESALQQLEAEPSGWADWHQPTIQPIHQAAMRYAATARNLAQGDGTCDPDLAWIGGLMAPLGWFGVAVVDGDAVVNCLADPDFARQPAAVQRRHWQMDAASLARRLARRWQLPGWLAALVGHLKLSAELAVRFYAESKLFHVVRQAVQRVEQEGGGLGLLPDAAGLQSRAALAVAAPNPAQQATAAAMNVESGGLICQPPAKVPLLKDLLQMAAQNLRLQGLPHLEQAEDDLDELHAALEQQQAAEAERLREQKLRALAEFAAGAGHEINNPLAVISGQAQYLLRKAGSRQPAAGSKEDAAHQAAPAGSASVMAGSAGVVAGSPDPAGVVAGSAGVVAGSAGVGGGSPPPATTSEDSDATQGSSSHSVLSTQHSVLSTEDQPRPASPAASALPASCCLLPASSTIASLEAIIAQTHRIHQILRDLMQFARPPQPMKQVIDLGVLVRETATALAELASQREVRLECTQPPEPIYVEADSGQIRTALTCLLRNAVEAAPSGPDVAGWASIGLAADAGRVEVLIEDNGPGPAPLEREHLFDPFFSGRAAGRGRGLGLPIAWRLARQHGGDVIFSRPTDGPTRFTLRLSRAAAPQAASGEPVAA